MKMHGVHKIFYYFLVLSNSFHVYTVKADAQTKSTLENCPFSPKASLIRYWNKQIVDSLSKPSFLFSKASPLTAIDTAFFTKLATQQSLSTNINSFCSLANLFCSFDDPKQNRLSSTDVEDANFAVYSNKQFSSYGSSRVGGVDSFKNYSDKLNSASASFTKYSRDSTGHDEAFTSYGTEGNVADATFGNYGSGATGGSGDFKNYAPRVNIPALKFNSYDSDGNNHKLSFTSYSGETNSGSQLFTSYGNRGNNVPSEFTAYSADANIIESAFIRYGEFGNGGNDSFTGYGLKGNDLHSNFKSYGNEGNVGGDSFANYRTGANFGESSFQSYARNSNAGKVNFANYGKTFSGGNDAFIEYGKGSFGRPAIEFKSYSKDRSFKDYNDKGVSFAGYDDTSSVGGTKWGEPGKFFRESMLREGNVIVMPDINDKMPRRSFLPRVLLSKLPFSTSRLTELKQIFQAQENSTMEQAIIEALLECERKPSAGETKRCVGSIEDMMDFVISMLGHNVTVRTTSNVNGSKQNVMIGLIEKINASKTVSCHQSLYPYLLYYCHSVPNVRVYQVDIHEVESVEKAKVNRGIAICHIDTSAWSPSHGAFAALGFSPGQIEVCHWIFENDMSWTAST